MNILLISLLGCLVVALPSASAQKVKWCVKTPKELEKCKHLASKSTDIECLLQPSITDCIKIIEKGEADAVTVDGEHVYFGGLKPYELRPIIAEKYKDEPCYAVAVVKRDTGFSIKDLKGKTSCHSCYTSPRGWDLPIGQLIKKRIIDWVPDDMPLERGCFSILICASSFPFLVSFPRVSAPPPVGREGRLQGKKRRTEESNESVFIHWNT